MRSKLRQIDLRQSAGRKIGQEVDFDNSCKKNRTLGYLIIQEFKLLRE